MDPSQMQAPQQAPQQPQQQAPQQPGPQKPRPFGADESMAENESPEQPATEEEQQLYNLVVGRAWKFIYGKGKDQVLQALSAGKDPAEGIGMAAAMIIGAIEASALEANKPIGDAILYHAGVEVIEDLAEFGIKAKVFEFKDEQEQEEQVELALFHAMKIYGEQGLQSGSLDPEAAKKVVQDNIQREQQASGNTPVGKAVHSAMQPQQAPPGAEGIARQPGLIGR